MFYLPDDEKIVFAAALATSWKLDQGFLPSIDDYRARRRVQGRGQRSGHVGIGRLYNLDYTQTIIKREVRYRDDRVAPRRRIKVLIDMSFADNSPSTKQLIGVSIFAICCLANIAGVSVVVRPIGKSNLFRELTVPNPPRVSALKHLFKVWLGERHEFRMSAPLLRLAAGDTSQEHYVLISHYIHPSMIDALKVPMGLTVLFVEPKTTPIFLAGAGVNRGQFGASSQPLAYHEFAELYAFARRRLSGNLRSTLVVESLKPPIPAVTAALGIGSLRCLSS